MTVLVTGGTGFVGPKVVHALRAADRPVRVLARKPERQERFRAWGCEVVQGDMTDAASLKRALEGCEAVVHLVALPPFADPKAAQRVMEQGTRDLVAAAEEAGIRRFVLMSALGVTEETKDLSAYNHGKWEEEQAVQGSALDSTIFRPSFVFGPDGGLLPGLLRLTRWSPLTPVPSERRLQPIWGEDVAAYFARALEIGAKGNGIWELAGPDQVTWAELYERIRRVTGKRRLAFQIPGAVLRTGAAAATVLPPLRGAPGAVRMLELDDNMTDIRPAVQAFEVQPIGLDDQLRRAARTN
jgi:NADH dehydrogenase